MSQFQHPCTYPSPHWLQLVPALDACLRQDNWLDRQAQTSVSAPTSLRSCAIDSQPGIFFPPGSHAEFNLQGKGYFPPFTASSMSAFLHLLPPFLPQIPRLEASGGSFLSPDIPQPHAEPWAFSLDLGLQLAAGSGHLLALGTPENPSWLSLHLQNQVRGDTACIQWHLAAVGEKGTPKYQY